MNGRRSVMRSSSSNNFSALFFCCTQVARRFLAAVQECSGSGPGFGRPNMAFFISCDPDDVMRQAEQSALRYQQGT
jgi:hypothetical protein